MKLGLGTVQFGMPYGIAHRGEAISSAELAATLRRATESGIDCLDTAPAYGDSEARLGSALADSRVFNIVTKTPVFSRGEIGLAEADLTRASLSQSLEKLRRRHVYGLLVHNADDLLKPGGRHLVQVMQDMKSEGLVLKIGISVYTAQQIDRALEFFQPDIVQLPLNVFDQRLLESGHVARLKSCGTEIHARSIFLQGLLLMAPDTVPDYFSPLQENLSNYRELLRTRSMKPIQGALAFVRQIAGVDYAVVGAQSTGELEEIYAAAQTPFDGLDFSRLAVTDENMIVPSRWKAELT